MPNQPIYLERDDIVDRAVAKTLLVLASEILWVEAQGPCGHWNKMLSERLVKAVAKVMIENESEHGD